MRDLCQGASVIDRRIYFAGLPGQRSIVGLEAVGKGDPNDGGGGNVVKALASRLVDFPSCHPLERVLLLVVPVVGFECRALT